MSFLVLRERACGEGVALSGMGVPMGGESERSKTGSAPTATLCPSQIKPFPCCLCFISAFLRPAPVPWRTARGKKDEQSEVDKRQGLSR